MIATGIVALLAGAAGAAPIVIGVGDFSGSETVIDFTGRANGEAITTQYAAGGVTFSGGLYATYLNGNPAPSAQNYPLYTPNQAHPITIDFSSTMLRAGFDVQNATIDDLFVTVEAYRDGVLVSNLQFATGSSWSFVGIEDADVGIDRLVLRAAGGSGTGAFAMDNFRFESNPIPEPSAALLFPMGLMLAAASMRRRR